MNTTNDMTQTKEVLRDVIAAFSTHPAALRIDAEPHPTKENVTLWQVRGAPEDEPVHVGKKGSHVRALAVLVHHFGKAQGTVFTFTLHTKRAPMERPAMRPRAVEKHNPEPQRLLLARLLEECDLAAFRVDVVSRPSSNLSFELRVVVTSPDDYSTLTVPEDSRSTETLVGAIGTLFRAIGKNLGVEFEVAVVLVA